jgi:DNA adenine methylase
MNQPPLFSEVASSDHIVNVASVPHRSPFRYAGGKTWLVPRIRRWLATLPTRPVDFIEPFAGGAIVGLTVAFEQLADHVTLVELDDQVAAVWKTIIEDNEGEWLADQIRSFELSSVNVHALLGRNNLSRREQALQTLIKNRVNRGGILAPGAGKLKHGESGKGIASRWYPETLRKRILNIASVRDRLTFVHGDGLKILRQNIHRTDIVFFIDPPYTAAGKKAGSRLYTHNDLNHEELFAAASALAGDFLMTYDNNETIRVLASYFGLDTEAVAMKNTHHAKQTELLIGRDLSWLRQAT